MKGTSKKTHKKYPDEVSEENDDDDTDDLVAWTLKVQQTNEGQFVEHKYLYW